VRHNARQAHELTRAAIDSINQRERIPSATLLLVGIDVAERVREVEALRRDMAAAEALTDETNLAAGSLLLRKARIAEREGRLDDALQDARRAEQVFATLNLARDRAIAMGQIADVLEDRGELDEALRIRREEELPVYEQLSDVRERAVTMGKIADRCERIILRAVRHTPCTSSA
jgi:tetratricopeptide (TPR) repeat protein